VVPARHCPREITPTKRPALPTGRPRSLWDRLTARYRPKVQKDAPSVRAGPLMSQAVRDLWRRPLAILVILSLFLSAAWNAAGQDDLMDLLLALIVTVATIYVQIAVNLAGSSNEPGPSGDAWFRAALTRRCFWRLVAVEISVTALVAVGALALVVGAIVVGGITSLAEPAVVLDRDGPIEAIRRSARMSRPARRPLTVIFGLLVLAPSLVGPAAALAGIAGTVLVGIGVVLLPISMAGTVALARAYVALGGTPAPAPNGTPEPRLTA
jgi:hypothetical protein